MIKIEVYSHKANLFPCRLSCAYSLPFICMLIVAMHESEDLEYVEFKLLVVGFKYSVSLHGRIKENSGLPIIIFA